MSSMSPELLRFWQQITRRRVLPLYRHLNLHSKGDAAPHQGYVEAEDGSITEGDDYVWSGNRELMTDGAWRHIGSEKLRGKRTGSAQTVDGDEAREELTQFRSSSPIAYGSDDEHESMNRCSFASDVGHFVADIRRHEETARTRDKTWADNSNATEQRRMMNTMGYQLNHLPVAEAEAGPSQTSI
ncbi:hypothetical protein C8J56DRAFT_895759 [Mycena floridula]|nr:hypothetical protein C8J56DRAFT_895759 [Mycena floridula]